MLKNKRLDILEKLAKRAGWLVFRPDQMPEDVKNLFTDDFLVKVMTSGSDPSYQALLTDAPDPSAESLDWCRRGVSFSIREFGNEILAWPDWSLQCHLALLLYDPDYQHDFGG